MNNLGEGNQGAFVSAQLDPEVPIIWLRVALWLAILSVPLKGTSLDTQEPTPLVARDTVQHPHLTEGPGL